MRRRITAGVLITVGMLSGCDKSDNSATAPPSAPVTPVLVPITVIHPTTQQLESAPRKKLDLKYLPITLMAPDSWSVQAKNAGLEGPQSTLEGPTPADEIRFRLPLARPIKPEQEALLERDAKETLTSHPELLGPSVVRDVPGGKIIERLSVKSVSATTEVSNDLPASANRAMDSAVWTFSVCVQDGVGFTVYDLTVTLPLKQYKTDHAFVRSIMDTIALK